MVTVASGDEAAVSFERDGGAAVIAFTRPAKRNALRPVEWERIGDLIRQCALDPAVRAVVLTGSGGAFSAGFDLRSNEGGRAGSSLPVVHRTILDAYRCPKPVLAAVEGCCIGAAWALALACDLVIAGRDAFFEPPFASRGLVPDAGIAWFLDQALGRYETTRLLWLDGRLTASEAAEKGLVTELTENAEATARAREVAARLAAHPAHSLAAAKATLRHAHGASLETALDAEHAIVARNSADDEVRRTRSAFLVGLGRHDPDSGG
jgi:2-(1,2-epoxy-1,2-dihydrophenyl)acetyl-CoA isomerase